MAADNSVIFSALGLLQDNRTSMAQTQMYSATTLMQKGNYKQAVAVLKVATAYDPSATQAYSLMAQSYLKLNDSKSAKAAYQMVVRLDRNNSAAYTGMANIDMTNKNYPDAEKELKQAIRLNPTDVVAPDILGQLYLATGRNQDAATQFLKVTKMAPTDGNPYYSLGVAYDKLGKYSDAVTVLNKAVVLKKNFALGYSELGNAYAKQGNTAMAQKQVVALQGILTTQAQTLATSLTAQIKQPKLTTYNNANSSFNAYFGSATPLFMLAPSFLTAPANTSKDFTIQFQFDSKMDVKSVMTATNWSISKASGGAAGRYENGLVLNSSKEAAFSPVPKSVSYDTNTNQATLTFSIAQGSGQNVIDPSHMVFKFFGTDINGKKMDPTADQYDGFANKPF
jgi:tetratricopeptide (TPR) repeat protein